MNAGELAAVAFAAPFIGAIFIALTGKWPNLRESITLATAGATFGLVASLYATVKAGELVAIRFFDVVPGMPLAFDVEPLGLIYALLASFLWILNSLYSIGYMRGNKEAHQTPFYVCFALAIGSALGIAFSGNLFTMFVFYEVLTFSTYPLVTHSRSAVAINAGRTYLGVLVTTSIVFQLGAILWISVITNGNLNFTPGGILASAMTATPAVVGILYFLMIYGIGKCALMPAHRWLPAAMVAPTPVSALLHAVAVVKAGVFCVTKVTVYIFGIDTLRAIGYADWLVYAAGATIILASLIALYQNNLKRRLAYSTISQLSYIVMAAALFTPWAVMAAAVHIVMHAFGKITLFFAAGSIYTAAHKTEIPQLDGIGKRMPITMTAFAIGSLSMIGVPPAAGFVSKIWLLGGAWQAKHGFALGVIVLSTLLNAAYFLPIVYRAFFREIPDRDQAHPHGEAPWPIVLALSLTAAGTLALFFYPDVVVDLARALVVRAGLANGSM